MERSLKLEPELYPEVQLAIGKELNGVFAPVFEELPPEHKLGIAELESRVDPGPERSRAQILFIIAYALMLGVLALAFGILLFP